MSARGKVDWSLVEPDYRAGIKSLRQMGAEHGCSSIAVLKHARKNMWERAPKPDRTVVLTDAPDEFARAGFVYVIYVDDGVRRFYKIGMATHFTSRLDAHQVSSPYEVRVACCYFVGNMRAEESVLHQMFDEFRVRGEWFVLSQEDLVTISSRALLA